MFVPTVDYTGFFQHYKFALYLLYYIKRYNVLDVHYSVTFLGAFAKLRKATIGFVMSVCPHGTTRLPLDGF